MYTHDEDRRKIVECLRSGEIVASAGKSVSRRKDGKQFGGRSLA